MSDGIGGRRFGVTHLKALGIAANLYMVDSRAQVQEQTQSGVQTVEPDLVVTSSGDQSESFNAFDVLEFDAGAVYELLTGVVGVDIEFIIK